MKKLLTIAALAGVASLSYGQGFVAFVNQTGTRVSTNGAAIGAGTGLTVSSAVLANGYYFELLVAPTSQTTIGATLAGWTDTGELGTTVNSAGRVSGNNSTDGNATQIPGYGSTATADFAIVGWSANLGSNYLNAVSWWNQGAAASGNFGPDASFTGGASAYFGISGVATGIPLAATGGPYTDVFGPASGGQIGGFALTGYLVPEPTTFALAGLGAAALVIFRRRK
jgi:hypothetical protein